MVSKKSIEKQLKRIHFNHLAWGRTEVQELPHIILPDEHILECVNGMYEGGFALLVATNVRVLLIDKKPLNYLTVEDLRFDMISEIDYSHRLFGARISISTGSKNLRFTSFNQPRLRKLIGHVQHHMAQIKNQQNVHQEDQKQHLEQINQQLQAYLLAQHQHQEELRKQLEKAATAAHVQLPAPVKPAPELSDFLLAQRLLSDQAPTETAPILSEPPQVQMQPMVVPAQPQALSAVQPQPTAPAQPHGDPANPQLADLYAEGMQEIFGRHQAAPAQPQPPAPEPATPAPTAQHSLEINPGTIAYSKLPMALRNRKFGRPSLRAHSKAPQPQLTPQPEN